MNYGTGIHSSVVCVCKEGGGGGGGGGEGVTDNK